MNIIIFIFFKNLKSVVVNQKLKNNYIIWFFNYNILKQKK